MTEAAVTSWRPGRTPLDELTNVSALVADLLASARRAFDRDRETARRCIVDAAAVIERIGSFERRHVAHQGGLAPWQERRIRAYIDANFCDRIVIRELSEMVRLSPSHFSRAFKRSFGAAPYAFVLRRRIEHAQRLMLTTNSPLCQIALECGLSDQSHFSRLFQRTVGTSPNEWRRYGRANKSMPVLERQT